MQQPLFCFDLCSPEAYLIAERVMAELPLVPEWQPVSLSGLPGAAALGTFRCAQEELVYREDVERRARDQGLQAWRWPHDWPGEAPFAMRAATYAKSIGRGVAFSLAAFRQLFAGGRALEDPDTALIAAAACELHPKAVLGGAGLRSVDRALAEATTQAASAGVCELPALVLGEAVYQGPDAIEQAAAVLTASRR